MRYEALLYSFRHNNRSITETKASFNLHHGLWICGKISAVDRISGDILKLDSDSKYHLQSILKILKTISNFKNVKLHCEFVPNLHSTKVQYIQIFIVDHF